MPKPEKKDTHKNTQILFLSEDEIISWFNANENKQIPADAAIYVGPALSNADKNIILINCLEE